MTARQTGLFLPKATLRPLPRPEGGKPAERAAAWLQSAMQTVEKVYPSVKWGRTIDPAVQDAFDLALEGRFWLDTLADDEFRVVWRKWYSAHL